MKKNEQLVSSEASGASPEDGAAATSGGTAAPESATLGVSLDTTGQLTLVGEPFPQAGGCVSWVSYLSGHGLSPQLDFVVTVNALVGGMACDVWRRFRQRVGNP